MNKIKEIEEIILPEPGTRTWVTRNIARNLAKQIADLYKPPEEVLLSDEELKQELYSRRLLILEADIPLIHRPYVKVAKEAQATKAIAYTEAECNKKWVEEIESLIHQLYGLNAYQATKEDMAWNRALGEVLKLILALQSKMEKK